MAAVLGQWWRAVALAFRGELRRPLAQAGVRVHEWRRLRPWGTYWRGRDADELGRATARGGVRCRGKSALGRPDKAPRLFAFARVQASIGCISSHIWARSLYKICSPDVALSFLCGSRVVSDRVQWVVVSPSLECLAAVSRGKSMPRSCQRLRFAFKHCQGVFKVILRHFYIWIMWIWVLEFREHGRSLWRGQISDFWIF
jgi:hypothetical protein